MPNLNFEETRDLLQAFNFKKLFIEQLGWLNPRNPRPVHFDCEGASFSRTAIAELGDVPVYEIVSEDGQIPDARIRRVVHKAIPEAENLLVFVTRERRDSLWYWIKREGGKTFSREHYYSASQPGDLFLGKLSAMLVDISELEQAGGQLSVVEVLGRLRAALDIERVTKRFYANYQTLHVKFLDYIEGIEDERDRRWYTSVILNRLMFVYFLQRKEFLPERDLFYLQHKLAESKRRGRNRFYGEFLHALFFDAFAKPENQRDEAAKRLVGDVKYLNGGLFLEHPVEKRWPRIAIPDIAFDELLELFQAFSWNLDDTPGGKDDEINPDVLGYIFEKYINQKEFGAFYTRTEITEYLCERTIERVILDQINAPQAAGLRSRRFDSLSELLLSLDAGLCRELLFDVLPKLSLLDPACGSGAFLVAAMKTLIGVYSKAIGQIDFEKDKGLQDWKAGILRSHPSLSYYIKKQIITDNLFGVDIMEEAVEIARLRLFLALVASARTVDDLEPLPNIDFNLLAGNSLVGLLRVDEANYNQRPKKFDVMQGSYHEVVEAKRRKLETYKHTTTYSSGLKDLRDEIQALRDAANGTLNDILLDDFSELGIRYEQATWDKKNNAQGKPTRRAVQLGDIHALKPFHWGYEFDEVMNERGGFDAIITNPPWETLKPIAKEFCYEFDPDIERRGTNIKDFEARLAELLKKPKIRLQYLQYQSQFSHVSAYFRSASQYRNQIAIVNDKKAGTDVNLYKLFLEQCFNLLRPDGRCGIIVPSGIYTDLGTKQLREMLFTQTEMSTLFGLSNERFIFEGVDHRFKICLLAFKKGGRTQSFTAAFRIDPREAVSPDQLESFLHNRNEHIEISVPLVRRLSPDSLSVMEFKSELDAQIAEKMLRFPHLGEQIDAVWNLTLTREFDMTNDSDLFRTQYGMGCLPLYEGKMVGHFVHNLAEPRYWIRENEGRFRLLGRRTEARQMLNYQYYRFAYRSITGSTNRRTMVCSILPRNVFCGHSLNVMKREDNIMSEAEQIFFTAMMSSLVVDFSLRQRVASQLTMFFVYQLTVPRLTAKDAAFKPIVERAAKLICITPEFDDLAKSVGLGSHKRGVTDPAARAKLCAELDGLVAHLYGLTEAEFMHVLGAFPVVEQSVKDAAIQAYHAFALSPEDEEVRAMIEGGENEQVEFKVAGRVNPHTKKSDSSLKDDILKEVAAFSNSKGGSVLVGVRDDQTVVGLADDYADLKSKRADRDKYEQFLRNVFGSELGHDLAPNVAISFHTLGGKDICRVAVGPAAKAVYLSGDLYIRAGNTTRKLSAQEAVSYIAQRWP